MARDHFPSTLAAVILCAPLLLPRQAAAIPPPVPGTLHACVKGELLPGLAAFAIPMVSPSRKVHELVREGNCFSATIPQGYYLVRIMGTEVTGQAPVVKLTADATVDLKLYKKEGTNPELSAKLRGMARLDQEVRKNLDYSAKVPPQAMIDIDKKNGISLREILKTYGWPSAELVGYEAADSCWLLTQHAGYDLLKEYLPAMQAAAERGELIAANVALTVDRVLVHEGKRQIYGSQFTHGPSGLEPNPIEDPEHLDERRATVGLGPFEEYRAQMAPAKRLANPSAPQK